MSESEPRMIELHFPAPNFTFNPDLPLTMDVKIAHVEALCDRLKAIIPQLFKQDPRVEKMAPFAVAKFGLAVMEHCFKAHQIEKEKESGGHAE